MKIEVTYHAQDRLSMRGISLELVKSVLLKPTAVVKQDSSLVAEREIDSKVLRVVYRKRGTTHIIITAYYVD